MRMTRMTAWAPRRRYRELHIALVEVDGVVWDDWDMEGSEKMGSMNGI